MKYLILISILSFCHCRPQSSRSGHGVEIQKQTLIELPTQYEQKPNFPKDDEQKREANTRDILQKIAQVNLNHGLTPKTLSRTVSTKTNNNLQHYYQQQPHEETKEGKQLPNFQFPNTPFSNPIFDYLQSQNNIQTKQGFLQENNNEEIPKDYVIKRKVTHQQTVFVPNNYQSSDPYMNQMLVTSQLQNQYNSLNNQGSGQYGLFNPQQLYDNQNLHEYHRIKQNNVTQNKNKTVDEIMNLAKQNYLINNIKNIVSHSQPIPGVGYINNVNPYVPYQNPVPLQPYNYNPYLTNNQQIPLFSNNPYNNIRINPYVNAYSSQQYLPQIIPNPTQHTNNPDNSQLSGILENLPNTLLPNIQPSDAFYANLQTESDVESRKFIGPYQNLPSVATGRQASGPFAQYFPIVIKNPFQQMFQAFTSMVEYGPEADICKRNHGEQRIEPQVDVNLRAGKSLSDSTHRPILQLKDKDTNTEIVIDKIESATEKLSDEEILIEGLKIQTNSPEIKVLKDTSKIDPQVRQMDDEGEEMLLEEDKLFQPIRQPPIKMDELGNGIFIQRLKVRKGGVAIAGPGGIATAGSGGTAIVGPNGFAYTQPNGVAIAGPGSRVISVNPQINLSEFIQNLSKEGVVSKLGKVGRVVAVGPVVYHDVGSN